MSNSNKLLVLGLVSHLFSSSFPFLAKGPLQVFGSHRGALLIYVVAVGLSWMIYAASGKTENLLADMRQMFASRRAAALFAVMMVLATASVWLFYEGLKPAHPGDFTMVVRLEHVMALSLGFAVLGERCHIMNAIGALAGFAGWALVVNFASVRGPSLWCAIGYIFTSGAATLCAKVMLGRMDDRAFYLLRMTANMVMLVVLTGWFESQALPEEVQLKPLAYTIMAGVVLALLFGIRYFVMRRMALWQYSALSATQLIFTALFSWASGTPLNSQVIIGGCIVTVGVTLASFPFKSRRFELSEA